MYNGREVLITGGLGFLGSNLAIRLVNLGAHVTVVDSLVNGCGGNLYNIEPVADRIRVIVQDIRSPSRFRQAIRRAEVIFNVAGEISHIHSMRFPLRDGRLNAGAQLRFLEECARVAPGVRIVYAGTRQIFGVPSYLPVDEDHPIRPMDFNGIHKYSAVMYHLLNARIGRLDTVVLNLTNLYGPRMALSVPCQGFLGNFTRRLVNGRQLEVFGDGTQLRDPLYVDDAIEAFLAAGAAPTLASRMYNVGGPAAIEIGRIAEISSRIAVVAPPTYRPFPPAQKKIDIGSYFTDNRRIQRELGWVPKTEFEAGFERTLAYSMAERAHYLDQTLEEPSCNLVAKLARRAAGEAIFELTQ